MNHQKRKPGPKPLRYTPPAFRHIQGVEHVSTPRQFAKLQSYLEMPKSERPPYMRLGSSVPPDFGIGKRRPSATYAVCVDGEIAVFKKEQDPRAVHRWVSNARRPWNMAMAFAKKGRNG